MLLFQDPVLCTLNGHKSAGFESLWTEAESVFIDFSWEALLKLERFDRKLKGATSGSTPDLSSMRTDSHHPADNLELFYGGKISCKLFSSPFYCPLPFHPGGDGAPVTRQM